MSSPDFRPIECVRYFIYGSREFKTVAFLPRQRRSSCPFSPRHPHLLFHYSLMHVAFRNDRLSTVIAWNGARSQKEIRFRTSLKWNLLSRECERETIGFATFDLCIPWVIFCADITRSLHRCTTPH